MNVASTPPAASEPKRPSAKGKLVLVLVLLIAIVAAAASIWYFWLRPDPLVTKANELFVAGAAGDCSSMEDLLSKSLYEEQFGRKCDAKTLKADFKNTTAEPFGSIRDQDNGYVSILVDDGSKYKQPVTIVFVKESGEWKIDSIRS